MNTAWNIIKYPALTLLVVIEFFIISTFSVAPIEHALLFWLVTLLIFEIADQVLLERGVKVEKLKILKITLLIVILAEEIKSVRDKISKRFLYLEYYFGFFYSPLICLATLSWVKLCKCFVNSGIYFSK